MKISYTYLLLFLAVILVSCAKENPIPYPSPLAEKVSNYKSLSKDDLVRLSPIKWDKNNAPELYLYTGKKLEEKEFSAVLQSKGYKQHFFATNQDIIKVVVLEPLTDEELKLNTQHRKKSIEIGKEIPVFKAIGLDGNLYYSKDLLGKIVVVNFWFIKCPPCRKEIPDLNRLVDTFKNEDVVFLGFTPDGAERLEKFFRTYPFAYNQISSKKIPKDFGVKSYPTNIIIDQKGKVIFNEIGGRNDIYELLKTKIEELL